LMGSSSTINMVAIVLLKLKCSGAFHQAGNLPLRPG
jgi:hypothetical protein